MAALTTQSANDLLNYILRNVPPSWDGATTLYVSLHTAAVGSGGNQSTNEVTYTGYARVPIERDSTGEFTAVSGATTDNDNEIVFGNPTAGIFPITASHFSFGESASGAGTAILTSALSSDLIINLNVQPKFSVGTVDVTAA